MKIVVMKFGGTSVADINKIKNVISNFSEDNINSFKMILYEMIENYNKKKFEQINE